MKLQGYVCDKCGVESHVYYQEEIEKEFIQQLVESDHQKWSPECPEVFSNFVLAEERDSNL